MSSAFIALIGLIVSSLVMIVTWRKAVKVDNFGIVDVVWSAGFMLLPVIYAGCSRGWMPRRILITAMFFMWSFRLTYHLYRRVIGHEEDSRYQQLRKEWAPNIHQKFFFFFQAQALVLWALSLPAFMINQNENPVFSFFEIAGTLLWALSVLGEALADRELAQFKKNPAHRGQTCQAGLWYYSRHPNYFFEFMIWVGYFIFALGSPYGIFTALCPAFMLYLLLKVTGIPMAEAQSLQSRGDEYREYQRTTSVFVPWFKRK